MFRCDICRLLIESGLEPWVCRSARVAASRFLRVRGNVGVHRLVGSVDVRLLTKMSSLPVSRMRRLLRGAAGLRHRLVIVIVRVLLVVAICSRRSLDCKIVETYGSANFQNAVECRLRDRRVGLHLLALSVRLGTSVEDSRVCTAEVRIRALA